MTRKDMAARNGMRAIAEILELYMEHETGPDKIDPLDALKGILALVRAYESVEG